MTTTGIREKSWIWICCVIFRIGAKNILTAEKKLVQVTGIALFPGDIAPDFPTLSGGTVTVFGQERRIAAGMKARNPDGTVNYCRLEVI